MQEFLDVTALGRTCDLGQLYDSRRAAFLPSLFLYRQTDIKARRKDVRSSNIDLKEVKNFSDRADSLDVSASLSVSILCGIVSASGNGSYLNSKQDTSESTTVAAVARYRTFNESLDLMELSGKTTVAPEQAASLYNATHVVTSITYGGNVVGTVTAKSSLSSEQTTINAIFSASVDASVDAADREKLTSSDLEVKLMADIRLSDEDKTPTDPVAMIQIVKRGHALVGDGVPCEVQLMPLKMLNDNLPTFRELNEADLNDLRDTYDGILRLENSRKWLQDVTATHSRLFPTFAEQVRLRSNKVRTFVSAARELLREYLRKYRSVIAGDDVASSSPAPSSPEQTPTEFKHNIDVGFAAAIKEYDDDREAWRLFESRLCIAEQHGLPFISTGEISDRMNRVGKGMLAAILVPETAEWAGMMDCYGDFAVNIRKWRKSVDEEEARAAGDSAEITSAPGMEWVSIYADPLHDSMLYMMDDKAGTIKKALGAARNSQQPSFLMYGRLRGHLGGFGWRILNEDGWGVKVNQVERWRYVGDMRNSKPHGTGVMTYADKTEYHGSFFDGMRDGLGKMFDRDGKQRPETSGVFFKGQLEPRAVMVEVTAVNQHGTPVQCETVTLRVGDSLHSYVERIATFMGWNYKQKVKLVLGDNVKAVVIEGGMIASSEHPSVRTTSWSMSSASKITAYLY
ncbi:hypothetical protein BKA62DRAFT_687032 [Auriculariales sp. MPI-PUGE-AT-0066]|nr:hypothetical protein BKA62DRAFT_687032 [Auriculariales sp. MPI-PUGE-AT-0066]